MGRPLPKMQTLFSMGYLSQLFDPPHEPARGDAAVPSTPLEIQRLQET